MKLDLFAKKDLEDLFAKKDLEQFLKKEHENIFIVEWSKIADLVVKWMKEREKKEEEEQLDRWFECLSVGQRADNADVMWDNMSLEDKKEIANLE